MTDTATPTTNASQSAEVRLVSIAWKMGLHVTREPHECVIDCQERVVAEMRDCIAMLDDIVVRAEAVDCEQPELGFNDTLAVIMEHLAAGELPDAIRLWRLVTGA